MVGTGPDNEMAGFDLAEADSRARPITHDEIARMREAAQGTDESARDLVHAIRSAIEGQLFSPADEVSAIPEELAKHYLNFTSVEQLLTPMNESPQPAFDTFIAAAKELTDTDFLRAPTANALTTARSMLRSIYDDTEIISNYEPQPDEADLIAPAPAAVAHVDTSYDPRSSDYNPTTPSSSYSASERLRRQRTCYRLTVPSRPRDRWSGPGARHRNNGGSRCKRSVPSHATASS